jgi:hypothetical protein
MLNLSQFIAATGMPRRTDKIYIYKSIAYLLTH